MTRTDAAREETHALPFLTSRSLGSDSTICSAPPSATASSKVSVKVCKSHKRLLHLHLQLVRPYSATLVAATQDRALSPTPPPPPLHHQHHHLLLLLQPRHMLLPHLKLPLNMSSQIMPWHDHLGTLSLDSMFQCS